METPKLDRTFAINERAGTIEIHTHISGKKTDGEDYDLIEKRSISYEKFLNLYNETQQSMNRIVIDRDTLLKRLTGKPPSTYTIPPAQKKRLEELKKDLTLLSKSNEAEKRQDEWKSWKENLEVIEKQTKEFETDLTNMAKIIDAMPKVKP